jgi:hypothetical protein
MRKAQMEIIGLAFVVILISLGLLMYIRFQAAKGPSTVKKTFIESQKAANLLNTVLKTNTYCSGATINTLLQNCAENTANSRIKCLPDKDSCDFSSQTMAYIFDQTMKLWQNEYALTACLWNSVTQQCMPEGRLFTIYEGSRECPGQRESASQFIPTGSGNLKIWLDICI